MIQTIVATYYVFALLLLPWWGLFLALPVLVLSEWGAVLAVVGSVFMDSTFGGTSDGFTSVGYEYTLVTCISIIVVRLLRNRLLD
ncbi:MAG: hypothetical protein AAB573_03570 [Patescibacteria group bacterium]